MTTVGPRPPTFFTIPADACEAQCQSCGQRIWWIEIAASHRMPVSIAHPEAYAPGQTGKSPADGSGRGISHFVDCPHRDQHRRPR
jgi:hypothetical protein